MKTQFKTISDWQLLLERKRKENCSRYFLSSFKLFSISSASIKASTRYVPTLAKGPSPLPLPLLAHFSFLLLKVPADTHIFFSLAICALCLVAARAARACWQAAGGRAWQAGRQANRQHTTVRAYVCARRVCLLCVSCCCRDERY